MEVGKLGFSDRHLEKYYPRMYQKLVLKKNKISKKIKKAVVAPAPKKASLAAPAKRIPTAGKQKKAIQKKIEKEVKKHDRVEKNNSKLLEQLMFLNQRIETMERDKELYALVDAKVEENVSYEFTVVRIGEDTPLNLKVNENFEMSCSCMDWRIRCRNLSVPCKHIYYLLVKILTYELYDYYDNQIMDREAFKYLVKRRVDFGDVRFDAGRNEEIGDEICPICYNQFADKAVSDELLKCPDCHRLVHKGCVNAWMQYSIKRNCVYCKSERWNRYFGKLENKH